MQLQLYPCLPGTVLRQPLFQLLLGELQYRLLSAAQLCWLKLHHRLCAPVVRDNGYPAGKGH